MDCSATIPLVVQQFSDINVFPIMCYKLLNLQNRMCELCTFSQIQSQFINYFIAAGYL